MISDHVVGLVARLLKYLDACLPQWEGKEGSDSDLVRRGRILVTALLTSAPCGFIFGYQVYTMRGGPSPDAVALILGGLLMFLNLGFLRSSGRVRFIGGVACLEILLVSGVVAFFNGGLLAPALAWMPVVLILAGFIVGPAFGLLCAFVIAGELALFYVVHEMGYEFSTVISDEWSHRFFFLAYVTASFILAIMAWVYESARVLAMQRASSINRELHVLNGQLRTAQDLLKKSEARFKSLVQNGVEVIALADASGVIQYLSPSAERMFGYPVKQMIGRDILGFVHSADVERFDRQFLIRVVREKAVIVDSFRICRADGEERWVEASGINLLDDPDVAAIVLNARDVTERVESREALQTSEQRLRVVVAELIEAKERAEEMSRMKSAVFRNMGHEIRTPLAGILGFASILAEELDDGHQEFVQLIDDNARRLLGTLNSVIDLARLETDEWSFSSTPTNLAHELPNIVHEFESRAHEKGLLMETEISSDVPEIPLDVECFRRALSGILDNAVKYTDQGSIRIVCECVNDSVVIRVRDTGPGIDPELTPHIFDEFVQGSSGLTRTHGGMGLGLTVAKKMIGLLDGELKVSASPGAGSEFSVELPVYGRDNVESG